MHRRALIRRARRYFEAGQPLPLDLFAALLSAGVDVEELERNCRN